MGAEFPASALTLVGNFNGACSIHLSGAAITVRRPPSIDIATWPYNCIRQFRADDDTGRFSFVSGRRGPYGVAEYIFELSDKELSDLQNALTQFTGAQFSHVIPGSDSVNPRLPSVTSMSSRKSSGGRADSVSSADSTFTSPIHRIQTQQGQSPRLPPRDYPLPPEGYSFRAGGSPRSSVNEITRFSNSTSKLSQSHSSDMLSEARKRRSQTTNDVVQPSSLTPPTTPAHFPPQNSPLTKDTWVMQSQSYESTKQLMVDRTKPAAMPRGGKYSGLAGVDETPPSLPPRDYPLPMTKNSSFPNVQTAGSRTTDDIHPPSQLKKQSTEPFFATLPKSPPKREALLAKNESSESSLDSVVISSAQKRSNYDRLEKLTYVDNSSRMRERSKSFSPEPATPKSAEFQKPNQQDFKPGSQDSDDCSNLDFLPRSSPQVRVRSITPEYAHHLRMFGDDDAVVINRSKTVKGRRSPEGKVLAKIHTSPTLYPKTTHPSNSRDAESTNQKQGFNGQDVSDQTYNVPRHVLAEQNVSESVYHVPRPQGGVIIDGQAYHVPRPQGELGPEGVYNVPRPSLTHRKPHHNYHVPIPTHESMGSQAYYSHPTEETDGANTALTDPSTQEDLYNVPRSSSNGSSDETANPEALYNVPKRTGSTGEQESLYNVPRSSSEGKESESIYNIPRNKNGTRHNRDNEYETINTDLPVMPRLRPARSFESLSTLRVRPLQTRAASNSPPEMLSPGRRVNQYVDIDIDRPTNTARSRDLAGDNLYAEIPDTFPVRAGRYSPPLQQRRRPGGNNYYYSTLPPGATASNFSEIPPRRLSPDSISNHVLKAKQLSKEGYELCMPAEQDDVSNGNNQSTAPQPPRGIPRAANYKISDPTKPRLIGPRHSTPNVMETIHTSTALLGSSIPSDSSMALADEYVIVTRTDPNIRLQSQPLNIPMQAEGWKGADEKSRDATAAVGGGDEYELMNPARIHIKPTTPNPDLYATPNPHNGSQSTNQTQQHSNPATIDAHLYGNITHTSAAELPSENEYGNVRRQGSDDLTGMSPVESDGVARKSTSASVSSLGSEVEGQGSSPPDARAAMVTSPVEIQKKELVRIASGSPRDITPSNELRNQSRSHGNVLDINAEPQPTRKHTYVNIPKDSTTSSNGEPRPPPASSQSPSPGGSRKPPKPLPRSALLRSNDAPAPARKDHPYTVVELDKVKGNDNPLSSNEPDPPQ